MQIPNTCGILIKQIHDALEKRANNSMRQDDLTMAQVRVLLILNDQPDKTAPLKQLEQTLNVAQSTAAGIVKRLEQKEFIQSFSDAKDKRIKLIRITPPGQACCDNANRHMHQADHAIFSVLSKEEKDIFLLLLQKVNNHLK